MSAPPASGTAQLRRELARRRVFVFFFAFTIVALLNTINDERDTLFHLIDDAAIVGLSIIALALAAAWWRRQTIPELQRLHNALLMLIVIALVVQLIWFPIEAPDPADFGNEIPVLLLLVVLLINRVV